ncbi:heparin lyase I family protein [Actinomycetospora termitidis]|uniref:Heparin lyase I family protein n=1 Tax=Actinomycetospora termitidis TaxID=3053470 RepID=A0ABT7MB45_9PSEU|nr:heparin lyase I family protein [Actinomycetospora sp. Odt1-22]MDL5157876.1 heparin lyase I family protein [Actinomycetospora sp. Odt1-22]
MARHRSGSDATPRTGSWPAALDAPPAGPRPVAGRHRHDPATNPLDLAAIARAAAEAREGTPGRRAAVAEHTAVAPTGGTPTAGAPTAVAPTAGAPTAVVPAAAAPTAVAPPLTAPRTTASPTAATPAPRTPVPHAPTPHAMAATPAPRTSGHRAPRSRTSTTTRAAGALALFGALAGASVAAASTGPAFLADPPADTGELQRPDTLAVAPAGVSESVAPRVAPHTTAPAPTTEAPATTTTTKAPVDDGRTLWSADFRTAGMKNFKSTPWNNQGAKSPTLAGGLLNFLMPGGGKRSEVEPDFKSLSEGDEYYFGFSVRLAPDFPANTSDWQVITQFKNDGTGTPPLELKVQDGKFLIDGDGGGFSKEVGAATPGQWTHIVLKVKFSASDGTVSAWQDGVQRFADYAPPSGTMYEGKDSYVKTGIYRDSSIGQAGKLSFGSWAIGTSLGSVSKDLPAGRD